MTDKDRLEAVGSRGEACIILRAVVEQPNGTKQATFTLASGERLKSTDVPGEFETADGKRRFKLRVPL